MNRTPKQKTPPTFHHFLKSNEYTTNTDDLIEYVKMYKWPTVSKRKTKYYNVPIAFDIETSSFYTDGAKCAIMYEWTFSFGGFVLIGRTWEQFVDMIDRLCNLLHVEQSNRLVIYAHSLAFEFQFMRKFFTWQNVFALDLHKPIRALTDRGVEFRCSYVLSGYSLASVANNLQTVEIEKLTGDLDYSLIRTPLTPLTAEELQYCINDVQIVVAYIGERITIDKGIAKIPMTKTGYVRRFCRNACFYGVE